MIQVYPKLYVGDGATGDTVVGHIANGDPWAVVHAAKEPWHRQLLGYHGRSAPKDHPEYLWAVRGPRLFLNMVDAPTAAFVAPQMVVTALDFIDSHRKEGKKVLVHCNQGMSRSPTLALLYLAQRTNAYTGLSLAQAVKSFKEDYPQYQPGAGMMEFLERVWSKIHYPAEWAQAVGNAPQAT